MNLPVVVALLLAQLYRDREVLSLNPATTFCLLRLAIQMSLVSAYSIKEFDSVDITVSL